MTLIPGLSINSQCHCFTCSSLRDGTAESPVLPGSTPQCLFLFPQLLSAMPFCASCEWERLPLSIAETQVPSPSSSSSKHSLSTFGMQHTVRPQPPRRLHFWNSHVCTGSKRGQGGWVLHTCQVSAVGFSQVRLTQGYTDPMQRVLATVLSSSPHLLTMCWAQRGASCSLSPGHVPSRERDFHRQQFTVLSLEFSSRCPLHSWQMLLAFHLSK